MALEKPQIVAGGHSAAAGHSFAGSVLPTLFPTLWCHLSDLVWADGSPRATSTVTLFVEDGLAKLCLKDRELKRTGWMSGLTLESAAESLEAALLAGKLDWRGEKAPWSKKRS